MKTTMNDLDFHNEAKLKHSLKRKRNLIAKSLSNFKPGPHEVTKYKKHVKRPNKHELMEMIEELDDYE